MTKWTYLVAIVTFKTSDETFHAEDMAKATEELDAFGNDGWELAAVFPLDETGKARVIFKKSAEQF